MGLILLVEAVAKRCSCHVKASWVRLGRRQRTAD